MITTRFSFLPGCTLSSRERMSPSCLYQFVDVFILCLQQRVVLVPPIGSSAARVGKKEVLQRANVHAWQKYKPESLVSRRLGRHSTPRKFLEGRRGFALEFAVARVCREAGARVSVFLRDLDLTISAMDERRIEVIAEGLPNFRGAQFGNQRLFGVVTL